MSLFNLFSRPRVEKQRGYVERELETPVIAPIPPSKDSKNFSTPNLTVQYAQGDGTASLQAAPLPSPTPTAPASTTSRHKFAPSAKPAGPSLREHRSGPFEPPPLFQAYPQSTKHGTLELSTMSAETAQHRAKGKRGDNARERMIEENASVYTSRSRLTLRHGGATGHTNNELARKIFVLVTAGYLLQYAAEGPSNRLPERVLQLGKDSAAFASDLVPGKHFVLQVSQAVDQDGAAVSSSGSILSRLGLRGAATKRMTSSFLLVMPSATELESWMMAIKREIEILNGNKPDENFGRAETRAATTNESELSRVPTHRYLVTRNPSKIDRLASPTQPPPDLPTSHNESADAQDSDTATLDGIEMEASKLDGESKSDATRSRAQSDAPSLSSSAAVSLDQIQLNNLRSSESNSVRTSNTSHTTTSPMATPSTGSVTDSSPAGKSLNEVKSEMKDQPTPLKSAFRPLASYSSNWRRSVAMQKPGKPPPALNISPSKPSSTIIEEAPTTGGSPAASREASPRKSLTVARSESNLHSASRRPTKRDSKMTLPSPITVSPLTMTPPLSSESAPNNAPSSNTAWSSSNVPTRRTSLQPLATHAAAQQPTSRNADSSKQKRISFSMPLKVNPSGVHAQPNAIGNTRRKSQLHDPDTAGETPVVHTLTAKVDPATAPSPMPSETLSKRSSIATPRHSLLFEPTSTQTPTSATALTKTLLSPWPSNGTSTIPTQAQVQAQAQALRRPTSMQVRTDRAPFLSSVRHSGQIDARAIPIRGMKPSRSASNVAALAAAQSDRAFQSRTPTLPEEESDDQAMPLPERAVSPLPPRAGSRSSNRKSLKPRASLPELDLGIPVVGLGPPAPPPTAPLPAPPPSSRTTSPSPGPGPLLAPFPSPPRAMSPSPGESPPRTVTPAGIDSGAGLGIQVS